MTLQYRHYMKTFFKILPVVIVIFFAIWWFRFAPVPVEMVTARHGPIASEVLATALIRAEHHGTISSRIQGKIVRLAVDRNDVVQNEDAIVFLDDAELKAEFLSANNAHEASKAAISAARAEKERSKIVLEQAERDHKRYRELFQEKVISKAEYEVWVQKLEIAQAELDRAESRLNEAVAKAKDTGKILEAKKARHEDAVIRAPFSGIIISREREAGDVVVPGTPVYQLVDTSDIRITAFVDETALAGIRKGNPARVFFHSEPHKEYKGAVIEMERDVDPETREFMVDVRTETLPEGWAIGQRADVYIQKQKKDDALIIPSQAISWDKAAPRVFVLENGRAKARQVRPGIHGHNSIEILEGISPSDQVIIPGPGIREGKRVRKK